MTSAEELVGKFDEAGSVFIRGVKVPWRPSAPGPEDCCMSGCDGCVYDLYRKDLDLYQEELFQARSRLVDLQTPLEEWRDDLLEKQPSVETASAEARQVPREEGKA